MDRLRKVSVWALLEVPAPGVCLEGLREHGIRCLSGKWNGASPEYNKAALALGPLVMYKSLHVYF